MKNNVLIKGMAVILLIIFVICVVSCVNAETTDDSELTMLSLSKGGISINYPSDWGYSEATSEYSIMSISHPTEAFQKQIMVFLKTFITPEV